jgi:soluble lytic murein transglycosylase-like protein
MSPRHNSTQTPRGQFSARHAARFAATIAGTALAFCLLAAPASAQSQIRKLVEENGRIVFVNADDNLPVRPSKGHAGNSALSAAARAKSAVPLGDGENADSPRRYHVLTREEIDKAVDEMAAKHKVDPALIRAVISAESGYNPSATSRKGAQGLMQLMPGTAQQLGVSDAYNPHQNLDAGVRYLRALLDKYNGDLDKALAAYNAGEGAVERAGGVPRIRETQQYVQKVTDQYYHSDGGRGRTWMPPPRTIRRNVDANGKVIFTNE